MFFFQDLKFEGCCIVKPISSMYVTIRYTNTHHQFKVQKDPKFRNRFAIIDIVVSLDGENNIFLCDHFMDNSVELIL
jgi:hypothetical protein